MLADGRRWVVTAGVFTFWAGSVGVSDASNKATRQPCRRASVTGEVRQGEGYKKAIGGGLAVLLQPIGSGWILRVVPVGGEGIEPDYAEVATPPYNSVTPLSISTDFSFRAQDAIGWNPREFRFVMDQAAFPEFLAAYKGLAPAGSVPSAAAEHAMVKLLGQAAHGRLVILDAKLVPGTADQWRMAAAVASHFSTTAHTVDEAAQPSPLGKIEWLRFRIDVEVPGAFALDPAVRIEAAACSL